MDLSNFDYSSAIEKLQVASDAANDRVNSIKSDDIAPNEILGTKLSIQSTMMTMQILNRYHEWFS